MSQPPDHPARRSGAELGDHLALLRRRWLLLLGCLLAGGAAGLALMRLTPPVYTATSHVLVSPVGIGEPANQVTSRQREQLNLDTEAQIAQSAVVAAKAAEQVGGAELEPAVVSVPPNSAVLAISVTAADPGDAALQSRAYAQAYLAQRAESATATITAQLRLVLGKLRQAGGALSAVIDEQQALTKGSAEHIRATHRQNVLARQVAGLTQKYDTLKTLAVTPGQIISAAAPPQEPSAPSLPLHLGSGLMAGLLAGAALARLRDRLDTRLRTPADVERLNRLPVLADVSRPLDHGTLHELSSAVLASCPGKRLLVKSVPAGLGGGQVAVPLAANVPLTVLDGTDVGDLARADAALLLIGLGGAEAPDVAAAVRLLSRHSVPIIGAVTTTDLAPAPVRAPRGQHASLGKLVASGEFETSITTARTTPMRPMRRPRDPST
ncbi:Wzz/FepE/Etk N-terminal domain-containing protein [Nonomuraea sp. MCN248]|uniref:Wzz/FepE/Etk N-terminal domain-containing protein n=1 Tax=Nonomuraea corallina TaxID=2989783 RepID=A0ABT4SB96_9ACTN|nr:Wzz/FepE/Etk N-terminal domain-containing protein [Nonomuraea corallina]MDA0634484.1 Wzz/FepE/Etk N-terminal domain-containing protein [Nonomuraea corallina]